MIPTVVISLKDIKQCITLAGEVADACSVRVLAVGSLYHTPDEHELWEKIRASSDPLIVITEMHPRPMQWLLRERGFTGEELYCINFNESTTPADATDKAVSLVMSVCGDLAGTGELIVIDAECAERWYPVIDRSRCVSCGHCVQFCLFGVYSSSKSVSVAQPDSCKPGCPACSRVCPQGAIIFPLYDKDPAISGAPGRIMTPDPAARAMFYKRTGAVCPVCWEQGTVNAFAGKNCPECGKEIPVDADVQTEDELDRLIDEFDKLQFGG